jgi:hypothetical protein
MVLRLSIVLILLFLTQGRIPAAIVLLGSGLFFSFLNGPFYNS